MDLTQISKNLKLKTDFNAEERYGLRDINSIVGIVDASVTSLQALIFPTEDPSFEDMDVTNFDITGITANNKCFVFDIKKEYKFNLSSDITDHYVEENIAIQDHVGLKPIILEVSGCIGEINLMETKIDRRKTSSQNINSPQDIFNATDSYINRMGSLSSFAPNIVNQGLDMYNSAKFAYALANKVADIDKEDNSTKYGYDYTERYDEKTIQATKQFNWINWFRTQWWNRRAFSIVTPYGVLKNMYIMELSAAQPDNTRYVTNLNIKFKQIRKAVTGNTSMQQKTQQMETQENKTFDIGTLSLPDEYKKMIDAMYAQPPAAAGTIRQETEGEFNAYKSFVQTVNVPAKTGKATQWTTLNNRALMGGVPMTVPTGLTL